MIVYLESSAAVKLALDEPESEQLARLLNELAVSGSTIVSSYLLETELRRALVRVDLSQARATAVLERITLVELDSEMYRSAGMLPGSALRSLDAVHVAAALIIKADVLVSYDERQIEAAHAAGIRTLSPR